MKQRPRGTGAIFMPKGSRFYWVAYMDVTGKRRYENTKSERKGDAQRLLVSRLGKIDDGVPITPQIGRLTFDAAAASVVADFKTKGQRSLKVVQRRINKHLTPFFGRRRMIGITTDDIREFIAKRQADTMIVRHERTIRRRTGEEHLPEIRKAVSAAEINRELQVLKRCFSLAIKEGKLFRKPHVPMLAEGPARKGFFTAEQVESLCRHLTPELAAVVRFGFITGWRMDSEILRLEWSRVEFTGKGKVWLDAEMTKTGEARVFKMTADLRALLEERKRERDRLAAKGRICPLVFHREALVQLPDGTWTRLPGQPIRKFIKAWQRACVAAGLPGRIPHDLRRSAIRTFVRAGLGEHLAMKLSGHKTRSVFERYNITSDEDLDLAADRLDDASSVKPARAAR